MDVQFVKSSWLILYKPVINNYLEVLGSYVFIYFEKILINRILELYEYWFFNIHLY